MSKWMMHTGKGMPIDGETTVRVQTRNGVKTDFPTKARNWNWDHVQDLGDIIAYQVVGLSADTVSADERQVSGTHYKDMPIQPWAVMESVLTPEEFKGFLKGNIIKYAMRAGRKEGSDDHGKAIHYADKLKEVMNGAV